MSYFNTIRNNNPLAYWRFNESSGTNAVDSSGYARDGTYLGSFTLGVTGAINDGNRAVQWVDGKMLAPTDTAFNLSTGTIEAWVKATSPGASYRSIIEKESAYGLFLKDSIFITYDWGGAGDRTTGLNIADGAFHYVALTFDSGVNNGTIVYLDGLPVLTTTITISNQTNPVTIAQSTVGGQGIAGTIDEAAIYSTILSPSTILTHYNERNSQSFNLPVLTHLGRIRG